MGSEPRRRNSLRLQSYDYAWPGAYFVTICVADRSPKFADVVDGLIRLNDAGRLVDNHWRALQDRFDHVALDRFVIMPNHLHGILRITAFEEARRETLSSVVQAFKSLTTRAYAEGVRLHNWPEFDRRLWQASFYDHIIRDDRDLDRIRDYIAANPARWYEDREYRMWQESLARDLTPRRDDKLQHRP